MKCTIFGGLLLAATLAAPAAATGGSGADDHAPIGVMGDHLHHAGEWMLSYRFSRMKMEGNRAGRERRSVEGVRSEFGFPVVPTEMDMEMHTWGAMWAPHEDVTLMGMLPFVRLDMKHRTPSGLAFTTRSKGIGDAKLAALVRLWRAGDHQVHANLGLSLPTGSLTEKDETPMGRVRLPYPMQIGSGSWDLLPGLTYQGRRETLSWGGQLRATYRTADNDEGYRLGHAWGTTAWLAQRWAASLSTSLRLDWSEWNDVRGEDDSLDPNLVETADPDRRAGRRLDLLLGANWLASGGPLRGHRLAFEIGVPVHQDLDGPQLESDWRFMLGWQKAFGGS